MLSSLSSLPALLQDQLLQQSHCVRDDEFRATDLKLHVCKLVQLGINISVFAPLGKEIAFGYLKTDINLDKEPSTTANSPLYLVTG
jgi:hypothetical protein